MIIKEILILKFECEVLTRSMQTGELYFCTLLHLRCQVAATFQQLLWQHSVGATLEHLYTKAVSKALFDQSA